MFKKIEKRNGQTVKFEADKITTAIAKAGAATDEFGEKVAQKLTLKVLSLAQNLIIDRVPTVEEIQDVVEEVLLSSPYRKTARAYIIYREQHARIREISTTASLDLVDQYLAKSDWRVNENSNMTFSLQGLNNYISSNVTAVYWLNKIYPAEIREAHLKGDFHIHDLSIFSTYCVGWDLFDLLVRGFGGVSGKVESKPAKHFRAALGQIANFFYTLQGESAGAQAFANFDTLLAPFVRYDKLSFPQIRQALQEFIFNVNVPTRVGFQCISEDTEILTPEGWCGYGEVKEGSVIKTFNLKTKRIEDQVVNYVFKKKYQGIMYNLKNRIQDQLVSPRHKVVRKKFQTDEYILEPIEEIMKLKSPFIIPIAGKNSNKKAKISNEQIKLMAWIISEGTIERPMKCRCCYRVSIYQSEIANKENYQEIINLLKKFKIKYSENESSSLGNNVKRIRLNAESSRKIHQWFGTKENIHFIPDILLNLNQEQSQLFLETYLKADGFENCKIATSDPILLNDLQIMVINAGYSFTTLKRKPTIGKKEIYVLRIVKHQETYIQKVEKVNYKGIIWSPHTKNETIIARRKGKVFITGNTPFTNITLDLTPPKYFAETAVIIGGKPQKETYKEFQKEMDLINRAFLEVMGEGDGRGRVFTFPIPTYNITRDFDWENPNMKLLWQVTAKFGLPYFSNFINSDMDPADARSMCLAPDENIVVRINNKIIKTEIGKLAEDYTDGFDSEGWSNANESIEALSFDPDTYKIKWTKVKRFLKINDTHLVTIKTRDGKEMKVSKNHLIAVYTEEGIKTKLAGELNEKDILLTTRSATNMFENNNFQKVGDFVVDEKLAYLIGFFIADGNYLYDTRYNSEKRPRGIQFTFDGRNKKLQQKIMQFVKDIYSYELKFIQDPRYENSLRAYIYRSEVAQQWINSGIEKYNKVPEIIFNSSLSAINAFLDGFFDGDGYKEGKEIHINDKDLARDLVILMTLAGINCTYRERKNSQGIRIQHTPGRGAKYNSVVMDTLYNRVPQFVVQTSRKKPFYEKDGMPCKTSLDRRDAKTGESIKILSSDMALVKIESIKIEDLPCNQDFYDIELDSNHYFVHSLGNITHNCCRLRLDNRELKKRGGGLFGANPLTGSIGVVTINMAKLGYLAKDKEEFKKKLSRLMELAKNSLEIKRKTLEGFTDSNLYPYSKYYLKLVKEHLGEYWKNHFSTIGLIGMNEACLNLLGENVGSKNGKKFALETLNFMREKLLAFQKETNNNYNLEATPAEGSSYRLAKVDRKNYPDIICANEEVGKEDGAEPFYTNSTQLPVNYTDDIFEVLELQDEIQTMYTGGTVIHFYLGERIKDENIVKHLVQKICTNNHLPYFTITPTFSVCPVCGYIPGEHPTCPKCSRETEVYSRVVGYLRPVKQYNKGKKAEFAQRKTFKI